MIISIYYLKPQYEEFFRQSYDYIVDATGENPKKSYYEKVFTGEVEEEVDIDGLYDIVTNDMPQNFVGHDFGVSDVIGIDNGNEHLKEGSYYFCDIIGWDKLHSWEEEEKENINEADENRQNNLFFSTEKPFDKSKGMTGRGEEGAFFWEDEKTARDTMKNLNHTNGHVYSIYSPDVKNPLVIDDDIVLWNGDNLSSLLLCKLHNEPYDIWGDGESLVKPEQIHIDNLIPEDEKILLRTKNFHDVFRFIRSKGFDHIRYLNKMDTPLDHRYAILLDYDSKFNFDTLTELTESEAYDQIKNRNEIESENNMKESAPLEQRKKFMVGDRVKVITNKYWSGRQDDFIGKDGKITHIYLVPGEKVLEYDIEYDNGSSTLAYDGEIAFSDEQVDEKLIQSASDDAFQKNVATEIKAGKPQKQALAIAYSVKRKNESNIKKLPEKVKADGLKEEDAFAEQTGYVIRFNDGLFYCGNKKNTFDKRLELAKVFNIEGNAKAWGNFMLRLQWVQNEGKTSFEVLPVEIKTTTHLTEGSGMIDVLGDIKESVDGKADFEVTINEVDDELEPIAGTETVVPVTVDEVIKRFSDKAYQWAIRGWTRDNANEYFKTHSNSELAHMVSDIAYDKYHQQPENKHKLHHFTKIELVNPEALPSQEEIDEKSFQELRKKLGKILLPPRARRESVNESEELDRHYFASLVKLGDHPYDGYSILNDGYFVRRIHAESDDDAIQQFRAWVDNGGTSQRESKVCESKYDIHYSTDSLDGEELKYIEEFDGDHVALLDYIKQMRDNGCYNIWTSEINGDVDEDDMDDEDSDDRYERIRHKMVYDSDGFTTDYTLYFDHKDNNYFTVFGDDELYGPDSEHDMDFESNEKAAIEWFEDYKGLIDDDEEEFDFNIDDVEPYEGGVIKNEWKFESLKESNDDRPLRVCRSCLMGIEAHEGNQHAKHIYIDVDDVDEEETKCDWCEETGFDELWEI